MGMPQYPRLGERIAPAVLREALLTPLPPPLAAATGNRYGLLADLDESVWRHAAPEVCEQLADTVAAQLQPRLLNLPRNVRWQKIPVPSAPIPLESLNIGLRTFNCLRSLCEDDVRKLGTLDIGDIVRRRGIGARSFLDVLCALEAKVKEGGASVQLQFHVVYDRPQASGAAGPEGLPSGIEVEISRYPRVGQRLAPKTLSPLLNIPIKGRKMFTMRLKDLDASAWERFPKETCLKLAEAIVAQTKASSAGARVGAATVPVPRTGNRPLRIQIERRTYNCLNDLGVLRDPARLSQMSITDLVAKPGFGARCLVDLLAALESQVPDAYQTTSNVVAAARRLMRTRGAELVADNDPRFGPELHCLMVPGKNLKQMAEHSMTSPRCPRAPEGYAATLERVRRRVHDARRLTLEEELSELLSFEPTSRNREITLEHLGWSGNDPRTLEEVGAEFRMTRERVRQICERHLDYLEGKRPYLPTLDRVLNAVATELPCAASRVGTILTSQQLTKGRFSLNGIALATEITSRKCPFVLESVGELNYAVPAKMAGVATLVGQIARKSISHWGLQPLRTSRLRRAQSQTGRFPLSLPGRCFQPSLVFGGSTNPRAGFGSNPMRGTPC